MPVEQKSGDELDKPIWGVEAIAAAANLTVRQAYHALESGYLPGSKAAENGSRLGAGYSPGFPARTEVIMAMHQRNEYAAVASRGVCGVSELVIRRPAIGKTSRMRNAITIWD